MSQYGAPDEARIEDTLTHDLEAQRDSVAKAIPIPSVLPALHTSTTPLPAIPLIVLSISVMSEFLCANVSTPFLFSMVRGFTAVDDEVIIGYWTGILVSVFFLAQFATSLVWASLVDRFGRRTVLIVSLLGSTVTCVLFGVQSTFASALVVRIVQGIFAGAVGVARSGVTSVTDPTNEGRAYAIMGFAWGLGGVIGAVIGGTFESPSEKWPTLFGHVALLKLNPYVLPCAMVACITLTGATMCIFLDQDGLPRQWSPPYKLQHDPEEVIIQPHTTIQPSIGFPRLDSYTSHVSQVSHLPYRNAAVVAFTPPALRRVDSLNAQPEPAEAGTSIYTSRPTGSTGEVNMNVVERIIATSENHATSLPELWVAAAINTDVICDDEAAEQYISNTENNAGERNAAPSTIPPHERLPLLRYNSVNTIDRQQPIIGTRTSLRMYRTLTTSSFAISNGSITRRAPSIFANTGVRNAHGFDALSASERIIYEDDASMVSGVHEHMHAFQTIPLLFILQYGLLALHTTTHDQVFYSYLMTKFEAGGLSLDPTQFSQLIAAMSVAQLFYQFYVYPTLGPPRGPLSHLAMFRLGCFLFIPSYCTVVFYRGYQQPLLMLGLVASTAVRYCATTFSFTSATILLNYLTPSPYLGLSNGLAQSMASLARFVGPALGAKIWAVSVAADPEGYALGFWVCTVVGLFSLVASYSIR